MEKELSGRLETCHDQSTDARATGRSRFLDLLLLQDVDRVRKLVDEAIRERRRFSFEYRITLADASVHVLNDRGSAILIEESQPIRLVGTCQDVSKLRQADQAN